MINKPDKKSLIYLSIVALFGLVCVGSIWYFSKKAEIKEKPIQQEKIKSQEEKLDALRATSQTSTEEGTQSQLKELEKLKTTKNISSQEVQKQLEELDKLRSK